MSVTGTVPLNNLEFNGVPLPGDPFRLAWDGTGNLEVGFDDPQDGETLNVNVDLSSGVVTKLAASSTELAVGYGFSNGHFAFCMQTGCEAAPNQ